MTFALEKKLQRRRDSGNLRFLKTDSSPIDFASNDYLGLSRSKLLRGSIIKELEENPELQKLGSTGSRLLTGNSSYAEKLEHAIAAFHGFKTCLIFNCGYMANVGLLSAVACEEDTVLYDTHVHASTRDGIILSKANALPFRHNDMGHLESRLKIKGKGCFVCVESIYSMDGSFAPLEKISFLCKKFEARLIVDEAHAVGIFGPYGKGLASENQMDVFAKVVTFGKALGTFGAAVLGSRSLKEALLNFARPCIYSTALPPHSLAAIKCAYEIFPALEKERSHLRLLIASFLKRFPQNSPSAVQPIIIPGNTSVKAFSFFLAKEGIDIRAILSPTVRRGQECLRVCLHAFNTEEELQKLFACIDYYEGK